MTSYVTKLRYGAACAALCFALPSAAQATAIVSGTAAADLSLNSVSSSGSLDGFSMSFLGTAIDFSAASGVATQLVESDAFTLNDDPLGIGVGFDITVELLADAEAGSDFGAEEGDASIFADQAGFLDLVNQTPDAVEVGFTLSYFVDAFAELTNTAPIEDALISTSLVILENDQDVFFSEAFADVLEIADVTNDGLETFLFVVAPNSTSTIEILTQASGFAVSEVPVPAAGLLFGAGFAGMLFRKRQAA